MSVTSATPLIALDAMVIDTETTGLDPAKARVIEIGAVPLRAGALVEDAASRWLVRPPAPVPREAAAVHGIDDAALADTPPFAAVQGDLAALIGEALLIGHSLGFDLAVLAGEFRRAGAPWRKPRGLCTRLLSEVAFPNLPDYSLDKLAVLFGIAPDARHTAVGDAVMTGRLFLALLPRLREMGIRTLAEAERASGGLTRVLDEQHRAGWAAAVEKPRPPEETSPPRLDLYPYRNRVGAVMNAPVFAPADLPLGEALARMAHLRISSLLVEGSGPEGPGIVTERDVMRALAATGAAALAQPLGPLASRPLHAVSADAFAYRAIARMSRLGIRHLGVTGVDGTLAGVVSARDLLRLRAHEALWLGDEIDSARDVASLGRAWSRLLVVVSALRREGVGGREIAALVSEELQALTGRAAFLAERGMAERGRGAPPARYAVAVLGSAGRGESLLALDQDNALIFDGGADAEPWFADVGKHLADILHEAGVPYCRGGVMASNPQWRGSPAVWRARVAQWIGASDPQQLLSVDIFFDLRGVYGDLSLAQAVWRDAFAQARGQAGFAKLLAETAGSVSPGLGLFGRFIAENGRIDLKRGGLFGIVTAARVLAIRHHVVAHSTADRLAGLLAMDVGGDRDLAALAEAQDVFLGLIADQQVDDIAHGLPPSNAVAIKRLSVADRDRLRSALGAVRHLDALIRDLLFRG